MEKELEPIKAKLNTDRSSTKKYDEKVDEWKVSRPLQCHLLKMLGMRTADLQRSLFSINALVVNWLLPPLPQNKVEEAERKKRQSQEQLDGITQQFSELQLTCSELKAKVQKQNAMLNSSEVSVRNLNTWSSLPQCRQSCDCVVWFFTEILKLCNSFIHFAHLEAEHVCLGKAVWYVAIVGHGLHFWFNNACGIGHCPQM